MLSGLLWLYAIGGTVYAVMYATGDSIVIQYATGVSWFAMMAAPVVLTLLVGLPIAGRFLR